MKKFVQTFFVALLMLVLPVGVQASVIEVETGEGFENAVTLPAEIDPVPQISVLVRVQSDTDTLMNEFIDNVSEGMSVLDVLLSHASEVEYDVAEDGETAFLTGMFGLSDPEGVMVWMYAVNNEVSQESISDYVLQDGDVLEFFFLDWENTNYAFFTPTLVETLPGDEVELTLQAYSEENGNFPVEGATLIIESDAPQDRRLYVTDEDGKVTLPARFSGEYLISATLVDEDGVNLITRPLTVMLVGVSEHETDTAEATTADAEVAEATTADAEVAEATTADAEAPTAEPGIAEATTADAQAPTVEPRATGAEVPEREVTQAEVMRADLNNGTIWLREGSIAPQPAPFINRGVVMVPFRAVMEDLVGAQVGWDDATKSITADWSGKHIQFPLDGSVDGVQVVILDGRVFVPLSFIAGQVD